MFCFCARVTEQNLLKRSLGLCGHKSQPVDNTINLNFYIRHVSRTIYIIQVTVNVQIVMIAWNWKYNYSLADPAFQKEEDPLRYDFIWMRIGTTARTLMLSIFVLLCWAFCCAPHFIQKGFLLWTLIWEKQDCELNLPFDIVITIQQLKTTLFSWL